MQGTADEEDSDVRKRGSGFAILSKANSVKLRQTGRAAVTDDHNG
jgi:hypothetical protein